MSALARTHLQFAVPLRIAELADTPAAELIVAMERLWPNDPDGRREPWILHADELMYGGRRVADSMNQLVDGLAVAALVAEGGITYDGLHWCRDHQVCLDAKAAAA